MGIHWAIIIGVIGIALSSYSIHWGSKKSAEKRIEDVKDEIKLSKNEIIEQYTNLSEEKKKEVIKELLPEFKDVKKEIGYSKDEIIENFHNLSDTKQKEFFDMIAPEFKEVKEEINISNDILFERIKKMDRAGKDEILKLVKPSLVFNQTKTREEKLPDGKMKTTFTFEVPGNYQVPENNILIQFDSNISGALMNRKQFNSGNTTREVNFEIQPNTTGIKHRLLNLGMNEIIELEVISDKPLKIVNLEII